MYGLHTMIMIVGNLLKKKKEGKKKKKAFFPRVSFGKGTYEACKHYLEFECTFNTVSHYKLERECCLHTVGFTIFYKELKVQ